MVTLFGGRTGNNNSFIIKNDNTLWAFGQNNGMFGDGTKTDRNTPTKVMDNVKDVSVGGGHTLVLKTDNTLWGMGNNYKGPLGDAKSSDIFGYILSPIKIMDNVNSTLAVGDYSMVLKNDNTLWVSGNNYNGQLGHGTSGSGTDIKVFTKVVDNVASMAAANKYAFIVKTDNTLWATGTNDYGQFGDGSKTNRTAYTKILNNVKEVATGGRHGYLDLRTYIIKTDNTIWATGDNIGGWLGDGTDISRTTFVPINVK